MLKMKMLIFFELLFITVHVSAWKKADFLKYGPFSWALQMVRCKHDKSLYLDVSGIEVFFYDFSNKVEAHFPINQAAQSILTLPKLNKVKKVFVYVGGYKSSINRNTEERVRQAFRDFPNSYLIIIDHSPYTNSKPGYKKGYERSVQYVYYIGKQLAQMLVELEEGGISPRFIHCIGHSLGSQILAHTGEYFLKRTGNPIWRITALDPAGPCFSNSHIGEQIRSGVAQYVEVYHCNAGGFGTTSILGDVDFFVNKGQSQPNCKRGLIPGFFDSPKIAKCHHKTCIRVWLASIADSSRYTAYKCEQYKHFKNNKCLNNERTTAGFWNPGNATGVYYFSTKKYTFD